MLGLAFQNPDVMFFYAYRDQECPMCGKRTRTFFLLSLQKPICMECFDWNERFKHSNIIRGDFGFVTNTQGAILSAVGWA